MTGSDDSEAGTRPISVAELLAKNGTIGAAPPGGGRRRRRRGNSDAVTVAELTGEIPIVRDEPAAAPEPEAEPEPPTTEAEPATDHPSAGTNGVVRDSPPELADQPVARRGKVTAPERSHYPFPVRKTDQRNGSGSPAAAEAMSPDPIAEESSDTGLSTSADLDPVLDSEILDADEQPDELGLGDASYLQTYLRATSGPLFGGQTVADDLARRGTEDSELTVGEELEAAEALEDGDAGDSVADDSALDRPSRGRLVVRGLLIAAQSIVAVVFGAGLFIAFDQLWKWNSIVALILGVLVILGLVVGVRVVRKTEDIGSTLTAVAVGALVTFGPLALLQAS